MLAIKRASATLKTNNLVILKVTLGKLNASKPVATASPPDHWPKVPTMVVEDKLPPLVPLPPAIAHVPFLHDSWLRKHNLIPQRGEHWRAVARLGDTVLKIYIKQMLRQSRANGADKGLAWTVLNSNALFARLAWAYGLQGQLIRSPTSQAMSTNCHLNADLFEARIAAHVLPLILDASAISPGFLLDAFMQELLSPNVFPELKALQNLTPSLHTGSAFLHRDNKYTSLLSQAIRLQPGIY